MIGLQHHGALFFDFRLICELQLPKFTHTVATVSRLACLASFTKHLGFIAKKGLCGAVDNRYIPALFVPFLDCTWPKNFERMLTAY